MAQRLLSKRQGKRSVRYSSVRSLAAHKWWIPPSQLAKLNLGRLGVAG